MGGGNSAEKQLAKAYKQMADAVREAAKIQAESAHQASMIAQDQFDQSLAFLNHTYQSARNDLSPYRGQGFAATQELYELMGINPPIELNTVNPNPDYPTLADFIHDNGGYSRLAPGVWYNVQNGDVEFKGASGAGLKEFENGGSPGTGQDARSATYDDLVSAYYKRYPQAKEDRDKISYYVNPTDLGAFTQDQLNKLQKPLKPMLSNLFPRPNNGEKQTYYWSSDNYSQPHYELPPAPEGHYWFDNPRTYTPGVTLAQDVVKAFRAAGSDFADEYRKYLKNKDAYDGLYGALKDKVGSTDWQDQIYNDPNLRKYWKQVYGTDITYKPKSAEELSKNALQKLRNSPGYQFAFDQGQEALENSKAAQGMLGSGNTFKEISNYGQNMADQQYQQRIANLQQMIQTGQQSAAMSAQQTVSQGQDQAAMRKNLGDTQGSSQMAQANAIANGLLTSKRWDILSDAANSRAKAGGIGGGFGMIQNVMGMAGGMGGGMKKGGKVRRKKPTLMGENY